MLEIKYPINLKQFHSSWLQWQTFSILVFAWIRFYLRLMNIKESCFVADLISFVLPQYKFLFTYKIARLNAFTIIERNESVNKIFWRLRRLFKQPNDAKRNEKFMCKKLPDLRAFTARIPIYVCRGISHKYIDTCNKINFDLKTPKHHAPIDVNFILHVCSSYVGGRWVIHI